MMIEQLINELGDDFRDLVLHSEFDSKLKCNRRRWSARGGKRKFGHWVLVRAHSPIEALFKLKNKIRNT